MRIVSVVGARPQLIKAAVVSRAMEAAGGFDEVLVHTGQHYDAGLSQIFFDELAIPPPAHHLGVGSAPHALQTATMLERLHPIIQDVRPGMVLVYGDTNSTLAGALVGAKANVPVAHVEAGLRSFNRNMPEEINRIVTDHVSDVLFAPTASAVDQLRTEGVDASIIHHVGDVMHDAVLLFKDIARASALPADLPADFLLATIHRAENTDDPDRLRSVLKGLEAAGQATDRAVVLPLHPRTRAVVDALGGMATIAPELHIIEPVGYLDMMALEARSAAVLTDSGGVQKEAYFHRRPCVTIRTETEWTELIESGWNRLADPRSADDIVAKTVEALDAPPGKDIPDYGTGHAGARICEILRDS